MRFGDARPALRVWIAVLVLAALAAGLRHPSLSAHDGLVVAALLGLAVLDAELGRHAEGGKVLTQRAHKGLSAWPFAAAVLCSSTLVVLITVPTYAYVRWRGLKVPLIKWLGSGALLSLAAAAAQPLARATSLPSMLLGGAVFLVVEATLFAGCALTGEPADEQWLKDELRSLSFYANEALVLCQACVIAVLWNIGPAFVLLLVPSYAVLQRALLHQTLRQAAEHDAKTGLLTLAAWEQRAGAVLAKGQLFAVVLLDLDHFKRVNDAHGHLVGDDVLAGTADLLRGCVRPHDLLGRFGGEEFVVLLPGADAAEGLAVAERLRSTLETTPVAGLSLTASLGVCASEPLARERLREVLACADVALYAAKRDGRNAVRTYRPALTVPQQRSAVVSRSG
ncbi:MAG: diguanylate cyclase [Frankiales bacterium]|nr:diguanylate cyclase [Frankiales bacterium]